MGTSWLGGWVWPAGHPDTQMGDQAAGSFFVNGWLGGWVWPAGYPDAQPAIQSAGSCLGTSRLGGWTGLAGHPAGWFLYKTDPYCCALPPPNAASSAVTETEETSFPCLAENQTKRRRRIKKGHALDQLRHHSAQSSARCPSTGAGSDPGGSPRAVPNCAIR